MAKLKFHKVLNNIFIEHDDILINLDSIVAVSHSSNFVGTKIDINNGGYRYLETVSFEEFKESLDDIEKTIEEKGKNNFFDLFSINEEAKGKNEVLIRQ